MLVLYSYQTTDNKTHGVYQCSFEDFKQFYHRLPLDVRCMIVKFSEKMNGSKVWLWQRSSANKYKQDRRNYWQPVRYIENPLFNFAETTGGF